MEILFSLEDPAFKPLEAGKEEEMRRTLTRRWIAFCSFESHAASYPTQALAQGGVVVVLICPNLVSRLSIRAWS